MNGLGTKHKHKTVNELTLHALHQAFHVRPDPLGRMTCTMVYNRRGKCHNFGECNANGISCLLKIVMLNHISIVSWNSLLLYRYLNAKVVPKQSATGPGALCWGRFEMHMSKPVHVFIRAECFHHCRPYPPGSAPRSIRNSVTSLWPFLEAKFSGVLP